MSAPAPGKFRSPDERRQNLGDSFVARRLQWAVAEANRCLLCENPPCQTGCLAGVDIKKFIRALKLRNVRGALNTIREANFLVATCGRVCPQAELCEGRCSATDLTHPIAIGELQRFVGELALRDGMKPSFPPVRSEGQVAIVGGGPAGLSAAYYLRQEGIASDLYERANFLGGIMMSGIPKYRLPRDILQQELAAIADATQVITKEISNFEALASRYKMLFLACGVPSGGALGIAGENLPGVWRADELLLRVHGQGELPGFSGSTVVLGGGNTALDSAGTALRLGSDQVIVAYRRSEVEMPAWVDHRHFVEEEGVKFRFLLVPVEILAQDGAVCGVRLQRAALGEVDASGRRRPVVIPGEFEEIPCRQVVLALGNRSSDWWKSLGLEEAQGRPRVDPNTMETSRPGVFVGGDLASGGSTVVQAVSEGRKAARAMAARLLA